MHPVGRGGAAKLCWVLLGGTMTHVHENDMVIECFLQVGSMLSDFITGHLISSSPRL